MIALRLMIKALKEHDYISLAVYFFFISYLGFNFYLAMWWDGPARFIGVLALIYSSSSIGQLDGESRMLSRELDELKNIETWKD